MVARKGERGSSGEAYATERQFQGWIPRRLQGAPMDVRCGWSEGREDFQEEGHQEGHQEEEVG